MTKRLILITCLAGFLMTLSCSAQRYGSSSHEDSRPRHGVGHKILMYIPNRVFDIFDLVRARLRVGPGLAVGVRATKPVSAFLGSYAAVYVGLPGPRGEPKIPCPIGLESHSGVSVSVADATLGDPIAPNYSPTEIGASVHLLVVGADIDVDPIEAVDLLLGFLFIDLSGDDL